jgi:hypothetical protein
MTASERDSINRVAKLMGWGYVTSTAKNWFEKFLEVLNIHDEITYDHEARITSLESFDTRQQNRISTEPVTRYVKTTGNDGNDGKSWDNAYASLEKAYEDMPEIRLHECKILIEAGDYTSAFPKLIKSEDRENGSLSIVGVGAPRVVSGPYTIASVTPEGESALVINVSGATWTEDELIGQFILLKSGISIDTANRVIRNTTDTITVCTNLDYYPFIATDTFDLVTPAVKFTLPINKAFSIRYNSDVKNQYNLSDYGSSASSLVFHNVWIQISNSGDTECESIEVVSNSISGVYFDFCRIDIPPSLYGQQFIYLKDTKINSSFYPPLSKDYIVDGETDILNIGTQWGTYVGLIVTSENSNQRVIIPSGLSSIESTTIEGGIAIAILETQSNFYGFTLDINFIEIYKGSLSLFLSNIAGITIADKALIAFDSNIILESVHFHKGSHAMCFRRSCKVSAENISCDPVNVLVPILVGGCNSYTYKGSQATFIGASTQGDKAYRMFAPATDVKSNTWPASNGLGVNDGLGSFITRCD